MLKDFFATKRHHKLQCTSENNTRLLWIFSCESYKSKSVIYTVCISLHARPLDTF